MSRLPLLSVVLVLALAPVAGAQAGKAYKCVVEGKTTYQDHPCGGLAPVATVVAPAPATLAAAPVPSPSQLFDELQMLERHERELADAKRREGEQAQLRLARSDPEARQKEIREIDARWLPRLRTVQQHAERLRGELRTQCPKGAGLRAGRFECQR